MAEYGHYTDTLAASDRQRARHKTPVQRGFSQLDWARIANSKKDLSGRGGSKLRLDVSMAEVRLHRSVHDAWTVIQGKIYNIAPYLNYHPGGREQLMRAAGEDSTDLFEEFHPWVNVHGMLQNCLVGTLEKHGGSSSEDRWRRYRLAKRRRISCNVYTLTLEARDQGLVVKFAGQHVIVAISNGPRKTWRQYTPVKSSPKGDSLELVVKMYDTGRVSRRLCEMEVGEEIDVMGPRGSLRCDIRCGFIMDIGREVTCHRIIMVAGGTGITPMMAILRKSGEEHVPVHLVFCNTTEDDIFFSEELASMAGQRPNLEVTHLVSSTDNDVRGRMEGRLSTNTFKQCIPDDWRVEGTGALICGPEGFMTVARQNLLQIGIHRRDIFLFM